MLSDTLPLTSSQLSELSEQVDNLSFYAQITQLPHSLVDVWEIPSKKIFGGFGKVGMRLYVLQKPDDNGNKLVVNLANIQVHDPLVGRAVKFSYDSSTPDDWKSSFAPTDSNIPPQILSNNDIDRMLGTRLVDWKLMRQDKKPVEDNQLGPSLQELIFFANENKSSHRQSRRLIFPIYKGGEDHLPERNHVELSIKAIDSKTACVSLGLASSQRTGDFITDRVLRINNKPGNTTGSITLKADITNPDYLGRLMENERQNPERHYLLLRQGLNFIDKSL